MSAPGGIGDPRLERRPVTRVTGRSRETIEDALAVERPLEIAIGGRSLAVTLRTPGHDRELALGFLAGEGLIAARADVKAVEFAAGGSADAADRADVMLDPSVRLDWSKLERHFVATAACGLCGRAHLDALRTGLTPLAGEFRVAAAALGALGERMRERQTGFAASGGLHAAAWCDAALERFELFEDVGRHNAVDKVAGALLDRERYPAGEGVLWLSGRAGAELVLKAARARIPVVAAVGAPSTLAVELAEAAGLTLVGFARGERLNVYTRPERVSGGSAAIGP